MSTRSIVYAALGCIVSFGVVSAGVVLATDGSAALSVSGGAKKEGDTKPAKPGEKPTKPDTETPAKPAKPGVNPTPDKPAKPGTETPAKPVKPGAETPTKPGTEKPAK